MHQSDRARYFLDKALVLNHALGDQEGLAFGKTWLAQNLLEIMDLAQAQIEARSALEFAEQANSFEQNAYARRVLARVLRAQHNEAAAREEYKIALTLFEQLGNIAEANTVKFEMQL